MQPQHARVRRNVLRTNDSSQPGQAPGPFRSCLETGPRWPHSTFQTPRPKLDDGTEYEVDALIMATGYEAFSGTFKKFPVHGANSVTLLDVRAAQGRVGHLCTASLRGPCGLLSPRRQALWLDLSPLLLLS